MIAVAAGVFLAVNNHAATSSIRPAPMPIVQLWADRSDKYSTIDATLILPPKTLCADRWILQTLPGLKMLASGELQVAAGITNIPIPIFPEADKMVLSIWSTNNSPLVFKAIKIESPQNPASDWLKSLISSFVGAFLAFGGVLIQQKISLNRERRLQASQAAWIIGLICETLRQELQRNQQPIIPDWITDPSKTGWRADFAKTPFVSPISIVRESLRQHGLYKTEGTGKAALSAITALECVCSTHK